MDTVSQLYTYAELALYAALILLVLVLAFWGYRQATYMAAREDGQRIHNHADWAHARYSLERLEVDNDHDLHERTVKAFKLDEE